LLFLLNHGRDPVAVELPAAHLDLLTGASVEGEITLGRYGAAVLRP
jgi:beta-galactosidase